MECSCSMVGCYNSPNSLGSLHFFSFPRNFDLCMLWVQNCGKAELFEDFAYGGAQPFINRVVCSDHFQSSDFKDSNCLKQGLKPDALPTLSYDREGMVVVKEELDELDRDVSFDKNLTELIDCGGGIDNLIKHEYIDSRTLKVCSASEFEESEEHHMNDSVEQDKLLDESYLPFLVISKDKVLLKSSTITDIGLSQESQKAFRTAWKRALESEQQREARNRANVLRSAFRRANESEAQRMARNQANAVRNASRRASETGDQRKDRLYKNAVRAALRRSMESEEEQSERRRKNALRAAFRRSSETPEQKTERRLKDKIRSAERRKRETGLQLKLRRYNDAVRAAFRRSNETEEQRQQRRMYDVLRAARRRSNENDEQRQKRLQADRERASRRRTLKKLTHRVENLGSIFSDHELGSYLNKKKSSSNSFCTDDTPEHPTNDRLKTIFSNDELSNQSGYTTSECESLINLDECNENRNTISAISRCGIFNTITNIKNLGALDRVVGISHFPNFILHNSDVEMIPRATDEGHSANSVVTPEVVWCT